MMEEEAIMSSVNIENEPNNNNTSPTIPAATSFVVSFDNHTTPSSKPNQNKFIKKHIRNLSLPVANVYSKEINKYSDTNGVKPPENHSEGYFSSDPEDDGNTPQSASSRTKDTKMSTSQSQQELNSKRPSRSTSVNRISDKNNVSLGTTAVDKVKIEIEDGDGEKSDGGTYTIDQDSHEVINARLSIDKTFGITTTEKKSKDNSDLEKSDNDPKDWIDEWATQVLEHNQKKSPITSNRVLTKIPSPVYTRAKLPPVVPMNTPKTNLTPTSPPKQRSISLSMANGQDEFSDSSLETESYLRTTEHLVQEMFARANKSMDESGGDSDIEINGYTPPTKSGDHHSDSSCSETISNQRKSLVDKGLNNSSSNNKYNRAFSLRRNKNLKSQESLQPPTNTPVSSSTTTTQRTTSASITTTVKKLIGGSSTSKSNTSSGPPVVKQAFSRTDCGRFSMRTTSMKPNTTPSPMSVPKLINNSTVSSAAKKKPKIPSSACRSNSSISSRDVEFQNWKRRKSYDPMKAAAEGKKQTKKPSTPISNNNIMSQSVCVPETETISTSVLRSASFHGTRQLTAACGVKSSSEDNEEEEDDDDEEESEWTVPHAPKTSVETTPRGSRTSLCSLDTYSSSSNVKQRTKIEGVDSMVITAIASMSSKLKVNSSHFLKKLRVLYSEENSKHGLLTNEIERLDQSDSSNNSPIKSPSRQLTATLCNLKKIENALRVMDEAIFDCEEFE